MVEESEFYIAFYTKHGGLDAVRVRIDMVRKKDMQEKMSINLCEHPLYHELEAYVKANPSR